MSQHAHAPIAPPGWHYQPALGRWLWWDGYGWIDPAANQPPPYSRHELAGRSEAVDAPGRWWPPLDPIGFGAAVLGIGFMAVMFVAQLLLGAADQDSGLVAVLALGFLMLSSAGMPAVALFASHRFGSKGVLRSIDLRVGWIDGLLCVPAAIGLLITLAIVNVMWTVLGGPVGTNLEELEAGGPDVFMFVLMFVLAGIIAPITEEMIFRGAIFRGLLSKMGLWPALVLQGLLFGAMHYTPGQGWGNLNLIISLGIMGIGLGVLTKLTGRLGLAILAHAVFNISQLTLLWFTMQ
ncbi:MAG: CPBP family intramembrane metalloprotease [Actinobacteria bacterium]|nr:CPBP family intramembrane metalloprotease [Actinomycetota bacterium]